MRRALKIILTFLIPAFASAQTVYTVPSGTKGDTLALPPFPSAREIILEVNASCYTSGSMLQYAYTVSNGVGAEQQISTFFVAVRSTAYSALCDTSWHATRLQVGEPWPVFWFAMDSLSFIEPGEARDDFRIQSPDPPGITLGYGQGWIVFSDSIEEREYAPGTNAVLFNSVRVWTIGPTAHPTEATPIAFLDSLRSSVERARAIEWIANDPIAQKYAGLVDRIRAAVKQCELNLARARIDTVLQQASIDSSSTLTSEAYGLIRFNMEYLRDKLSPTGEVKGGVFMPSSGTLSVRAKPSVDFGPTDTLRCIVATVRWPAACNVSLGSVTGTYGFAKFDSVVTLGKYRYQKFRTTTAQVLSWSAEGEYELFAVSVSGLCGAGSFELTNALPGGEWFVNVNYLDKTDPVFY